MRAQGKEMRTYTGMVRDLVRAIQMSDLQISLPGLNLAPPSKTNCSFFFFVRTSCMYIFIYFLIKYFCLVNSLLFRI